MARTHKANWLSGRKFKTFVWHFEKAGQEFLLMTSQVLTNLNIVLYYLVDDKMYFLERGSGVYDKDLSSIGT